MITLPTDTTPQLTFFFKDTEEDRKNHSTLIDLCTANDMQFSTSDKSLTVYDHSREQTKMLFRSLTPEESRIQNVYWEANTVSESCNELQRNLQELRVQIDNLIHLMEN
jgi:archaellum component FlaC